MTTRSDVKVAPHAVLVVLGEFPDGTPRENTVYCYSDAEVAETTKTYRAWDQQAYQLY